MTWVQFDVTGTRGGRATLGVKVKLEVVECWVGGLVVILDRDAFTTWLAVRDGPFARQEITFEPDVEPGPDTADPSGLAVTFDGRVARSVLGPDEVARLTAAVSRELAPVDVSGAFKTVRANTAGPAS
jgi:hypothetical protein